MNDQLSQEIVLDALVELASHYPAAGRTPNILRLVAPDICEDLRSVGVTTVQGLRAAIKEHRRASRFWPTSADLVQAYQNAVRSGALRTNAPALPEATRPTHITEQQARRNQEHCRRVLDMLDRNLRMPR